MHIKKETGPRIQTRSSSEKGSSKSAELEYVPSHQKFTGIGWCRKSYIQLEFLQTNTNGDERIAQWRLKIDVEVFVCLSSGL